MEKQDDVRFEFGYEDITIEGISGMAFDVIRSPDLENGLDVDKPHINFMTGEVDDGHKILGTFEFKQLQNLELFEMGLKLIQRSLEEEDLLRE